MGNDEEDDSSLIAHEWTEFELQSIVIIKEMSMKKETDNSAASDEWMTIWMKMQ